MYMYILIIYISYIVCNHYIITKRLITYFAYMFYPFDDDKFVFHCIVFAPYCVRCYCSYYMIVEVNIADEFINKRPRGNSLGNAEVDEFHISVFLFFRLGIQYACSDA